MPRVLVVAEHDGQRLNPSTAKCVSCGDRIAADRVDVAVLAAEGRALAQAAAKLAGVGRVLLLQRAANWPELAAVWAPQIAELALSYSHVLGPSTTFGKDLMPRVAALLGVGQLSDIMAVEDPYRFRRPIYAGNAILTVAADPARKLVATVRVASFVEAEARAGDDAPIVAIDTTAAPPSHTRHIELRAGAQSGPDLQTARRVVAGGRGLKAKDNFALVESLAAALGAAVGASRAAVDSGFVANEFQVGQTGKVIAPELYIAVGISGAIQHMTGIKDARTIVAINKDEDAPIVGLADIALVADLFAAVPELIDALGERHRE